MKLCSMNKWIEIQHNFMISSYYHFLEVYKYCMKAYTCNISLCNLQLFKVQLSMILKKGLLTELEKNLIIKRFSERQYIFWGRVCFDL